MMRLICLALLAFTATLPIHAAPTSTDRFIVAIADSLEAKVIGDDELVVLIASADAGHVANPIHEATAELSTERFLAYEVFKDYIDDGDLDAAAIAAWARENLVENDRGRKKRDESREETALPWKVEPSRNRIATGEYGACGINDDGFVQCWGEGNWPGKEDFTVLGPVLSVAVGSGVACVIKTDNTVACWGKIYKHLFDAPIFANVASLSVGGHCACAVQTDGTLRCWGECPIDKAPNLGPVQSVSVGLGFGCAIKADNTLACWGGSHHFREAVVPSDLGTVKFVTCGYFHACVVKADDTVRCWGRDKNLQTAVPKDLGAVKSLHAGKEHTCAVKSDGAATCWGGDRSHSYGDFYDIGRKVVKSLAAGEDSTCLEELDGTIVCYGHNYLGRTDVPLEFGPWRTSYKLIKIIARYWK